jgi:hypothetical protein
MGGVLSRISFDAREINRSFVTDVRTIGEAAAIARTVISMGTTSGSGSWRKSLSPSPVVHF